MADEQTQTPEATPAADYLALLQQTAALFGPTATPEQVPDLVADLKAAHKKRIIDEAFATYQSLWMDPRGARALLDQAIRDLGEQGFGAMHGFLVPDGSYLNEQTGQINGPIGGGDRVWKRNAGWVKADPHGNVVWPS